MKKKNYIRTAIFAPVKQEILPCNRGTKNSGGMETSRHPSRPQETASRKLLDYFTAAFAGRVGMYLFNAA